MAHPGTKPIALKKLEGDRSRTGIMNVKEIKPPKTKIICPEWLSEGAREEWVRLAPALEKMGLLTMMDIQNFSAYCMAYAKWQEAEQHLVEEGEVFETQSGYKMPSPWVAIARAERKAMKEFSALFGLTPADRSKIIAGNEGVDINATSADPMENLLKGVY